MTQNKFAHTDNHPMKPKPTVCFFLLLLLLCACGGQSFRLSVQVRFTGF